MSIAMVRRALLWCAVINYGILLSVVFLTHSCTRLDVSISRQMVSSFVEQFDMLHYAGMSIFKIGIMLLNLVPYIALSICRPRTQTD